ncbi:MAG: gephyrin-like molybdotransferase Glp [Xanthobacteraceae bacterium]
MTQAEARAIVARRFAPTIGIERVPLAAARNRVLASDLVATVDLPPHDGAAVDGVAVRSADLSAGTAVRLRLVGRAAAGRPFIGTLEEGQAVRICAGAPMPAGADAVIMQESCLIDGLSVSIAQGTSMTGNCRRHGDDVRAGSVLVAAGRRLRSQDVAVAAALGNRELAVFKQLSVAIFSTGDEIREPGAELRPGEIWDTNRWLLRGLIESLGCRATDLGILPDDGREIERALSAAAHDHDLLVTSGGVSVGPEDHVGAVIRRRGTLDIWRMAITPGRPVGLGDIDTCPILALPGNTVPAIVMFVAFGRSLVLRLAGGQAETPDSLRLQARFSREKPAGRRDYLFGIVETPFDGPSVVVPFVGQGGGMFSRIAQTQGFIVLDEDSEDIRPGDVVEFIPLPSIL